MTGSQPPSGWYPDPSGQHAVRFWDGGGWTSLTRRSTPNGGDAATVAAPAQADGPAPALAPTGGLHEPRRGKRDGSNAIVGVLLAVFVFAGMFEVVNGESSSSSNPNRFAADIPSVTTTTEAPSHDPCALHPVIATRLISILRTNEHFPVSPQPTRAQPAVGACNEALFVDMRGHGVSRLVVYPSPASAKSAAASARPPLASSSLAIGQVVLRLNASLVGYKRAYQIAISSVLASSRRLAAPRPAPSGAGNHSA